MSEIERQIISAIVGFIVLFGLFAILESLFSEKPLPRWRRGSGLDTVWYFLSFAVRALAGVAALASIYLVARVIPHPVIPIVSDQNVYLQLLEALFIGDFIAYWVHRAFHGRRLWPIHAVHHSIEDLDWLAAARVHPLDTLIHRPLEVVPLFLLGFSSLHVLPLYALVLAIYPIYLHANVGWNYGPLKYFIASPAFHRWHHTAEEEGIDRNYAGLFPIFDVLFGTFYLPEYASLTYGLGKNQVMKLSLKSMMFHPFDKNAITEKNA